MSARRQGRVYALQVLYALDMGPGLEPARAQQALGTVSSVFDISVAGEAEKLASALVTETAGRHAEIDDIIQSASRNWRFSRMSRVDRNILRLATCELLWSPKTPAGVVINEAVELAKRFGTEESPAFVNGILDRVAQRARKGES